MRIFALMMAVLLGLNATYHVAEPLGPWSWVPWVAWAVASFVFWALHAPELRRWRGALSDILAAVIAAYLTLLGVFTAESVLTSTMLLGLGPGALVLWHSRRLVGADRERLATERHAELLMALGSAPSDRKIP